MLIHPKIFTKLEKCYQLPQKYNKSMVTIKLYTLSTAVVHVALTT
jgi:hypothetical protein